MQDADTINGAARAEQEPLPVAHASAAVKTLTRRFDWIIAGGVAAVFFLFYFATSSRWAFPGQSAQLLALLTDAKPNTMFEHYAWQKLYGAVIANVMAAPISDKLGNRANHEAEIQSIYKNAADYVALSAAQFG